MDLELIAAPAVAPVLLADAKTHLRVDHDDENDVITAQIDAAVAQVEAFTRLRLITQTVRFYLQAFPAVIAIPVWPVQAIVKIDYVDATGATVTLAAEDYTLIRGVKPRMIGPAYAKVWPSTRSHWNAVAVDVRCGFGDAGADVPADIRNAIKMVLASRYENREPEVIGASVQSLPDLSAVRAVLMPHVLF